MLTSKLMSDIFFSLAGLLFFVELWPQLLKTYRTKKVKDISLFFISLCLVAYIFFITGAWLIHNWILVLTHLLPFINVCVLFVLILKYRKRK